MNQCDRECNRCYNASCIIEDHNNDFKITLKNHYYNKKKKFFTDRRKKDEEKFMYKYEY